MIIDAISFRDPRLSWGRSREYIVAFLAFIESRLGVTIVKNLRTMRYGTPELEDALLIAQRLQDADILEELKRSATFPDEPKIYRWVGRCKNKAQHPISGASLSDERLALLATLGEALERYLWQEARDHFVSPMRATVAKIAAYGACIPPSRFAGISAMAREAFQELTLREDAQYLWTRATSLISNTPTYIPVQTVSGAQNITVHNGATEPFIRLSITTGAATWPGKMQARLSGALEVIERDAYMITWLNQITPPRIDLDQFRCGSTPLANALARCEKYNFDVHALRLVTDAPAHAICVVLDDRSGHAPRFAFGLKAHRSLSAAIEGALIEALRGRIAERRYLQTGNVWDRNTPIEEVGHLDRLHYWAIPEHAKKLEFLIRGPLETPELNAWDHVTAEAHLAQIVTWCKDQGYEIASVSLGTSSLNPTPWDVEVVVIPELQPTHLHERTPQVGGSRLRSVPEKKGYTPRSKPYLDAPHPFS